MSAERTKRRSSRKIVPENPNQLSLEFKKPEFPIEIHLPKQKINLNSSVLTKTKRALITLSV